jgi:hypothetical protein
VERCSPKERPAMLLMLEDTLVRRLLVAAAVIAILGA